MLDKQRGARSVALDTTTARPFWPAGSSDSINNKGECDTIRAGSGVFERFY